MVLIDHTHLIGTQQPSNPFPFLPLQINVAVSPGELPEQLITFTSKVKDARLIPLGETRLSDRLRALVKAVIYNAPCTAKWFLIGDDDTLWFPENVVESLKGYDHTQPLLLGTLSEEKAQVRGGKGECNTVGMCGGVLMLRVWWGQCSFRFTGTT